MIPFPGAVISGFRRSLLLRVFERHEVGGDWAPLPDRQEAA